MRQTFWTAERIGKLRELWDNKAISAESIASRLGCTKNAVIGRAHRDHLPLRRPPAPPALRKAQSEGRKRQSEVRKRVKREALVHPSPAAFVPNPDHLAIDAWRALPGTTPVDVMALAATSCRWPIDNQYGPMLYCGCLVAHGSTYCPTHRHRSRGAGTEAERHAVSAAKSRSRVEGKFGFRQNQAGQSL